MSRSLKTAVLLAIASVLPLFALHAQQQPPAAPPNQPAAKDADKPSEKQKEAPKASTDPIDRIKEEGLKRSQVMATLSYLTDVIGPRLTGSPNMKRANDWTREKLAGWGLENAHLEDWGPFGKGWSLKRFTAQIIEPQCIPLIAYPKAWSPGTEGTLTGEVVYFDAKTEADFAKFKGKLKGAIVLTAPVADVAARFEPYATRLTDTQLLTLADAAEAGAPVIAGMNFLDGRSPRPSAGSTAAGAAGAGSATSSPAGSGRAGQQPPGQRGRMMTPEMRARMELATKKAKFLTDEGVALLVDPSQQGDGGTLFVAQASVPGVAPFGAPGAGGPGGGGGPGGRRISAWSKDAPKLAPQMVVAKEHYNRLVRMIEQGTTLKMAVDLSVQFHDDDPMAYNTVAEIPGTDLKDEVVMLGGHLDSWHSGTGATDNAAGCAVGMEAVRILKALDLKPRRTIRIALWSGEEQGLMGSRAYVTKHFGKAPPSFGGGGGPGRSASPNGAAAKDAAKESSKESSTPSTPTPEFDKFSGYFNLDNGTGKIRGVYLQGNDAVRPIFRKWLQPFREMGATTLTIANTGGTDHQSFDGIGLPGFQFIQDVIDYNSRTHHSNQDVYDRIQADDMKQAAVIMAAFVYNTAMLDQKLPRKPTAR
jgi:hypothetical protein